MVCASFAFMCANVISVQAIAAERLNTSTYIVNKQESGTISGKVVDEKGESLPGATITIKSPSYNDPYLITNYFPGIADPTLLEIRRKRGIELSLEGLRFSDLLRWKRGPLMEQEWNGFYVPALNTPMDLNEDGILDVAFYQGTRPTPAVAGVTYVDVSAKIGAATNSQLLKNGTSSELTWMNEIPKEMG